MTGKVCDNFENYGDNADLILEGIDAAHGSGVSLVIPSFDTEGRYWLSLESANGYTRRSLNGGLAGVGYWAQFYIPNLPNAANRCYVGAFHDGSNLPVVQFRVQPDGQLLVYNSAGTQVAASAGPVIVAGSIITIQAQCGFHATLGTVEVRINGETTPVIDASNLVLPGTANLVVLGLGSDGANRTPMLFKAYAVYSTTGTYNDDWPLITGIGTVYPAADTADAGMTPRPRQIIDAGVLIVPGSGSVLDCGVDTDYRLGSGDFTLDLFYRPVEPTTTTDVETLAGLWSASTSQRSYRLIKNGPDVEEGALQWQITTDGTLATLATPLSIIYPFEVGHTYLLGIERESGVIRIYVDGVQVGLDQADAATYFAANAKFTIGGEMSGVGTTVLSSASINAIFDEVRLTPGVARYSSNYAVPTVPYPRSAPSDPDFANVVLLAGFDESVADESSAGQTLTVRGSAARLVPDDGAASYQTVNATAPLDDRYLEAAYVNATGVLTLSDLPLNGETVTLGAKTYTFNTVLGGANSILIGADEETCVEHLVAAINGDAGEGTIYGTGTTPNLSATAANAPTVVQLTATAITPGTAGNSVATTETLTNGSWTAATLTGGAAIPGESRFTLTNLPPTVTGVRWLEMRQRSYLSEGTGKEQMSFVVDGVSGLGAEHSLTTTPTYYYDVIEEDPDTAAGLTPTSIVNGSIALERTA